MVDLSTQVTIRVQDLEASIRFFVEICGLSVIRDRRCVWRGTAWLGPVSATHAFPKFVVMLIESDVRAPFDRYRFECDSRAKIAGIAERVKTHGMLVDGSIDYEDGAGHFVVVREPTGHLVEFASGKVTP